MWRHAPKWLQAAFIVAGVWRWPAAPFRERPAILIVKLDSLGDALLLTGALRRLRQHFRDHVIVVACSPRGLPVFNGLSTVDRLVVIDDTQSGVIARLNRVRQGICLLARRYEFVLHLSFTTTTTAHTLCAAAPARKKVWFAGNAVIGERPLKVNPERIYTKLVTVKKVTHEMDKTAELLRAVALSEVQSRKDIWPDMELGERDRKKADGILAEIRRERPDALFLALCAGARFKMKDWGAERFAELVKRVAERIQNSEFRSQKPGVAAQDDVEMRLVVLLIGGKEDREHFEWIREMCGEDDRIQDSEFRSQNRGTEEPTTLATCHSPLATQRAKHAARVLNLAGELTVRESAALIEQCDLCVGNDTFGLHAAVAVDTPSVVIMWGGDIGRWDPWGDPKRHRMVRAEVDCKGCEGNCTQPCFRCVDEIRVDSVAAEVFALLQEP